MSPSPVRVQRPKRTPRPRRAEALDPVCPGRRPAPSKDSTVAIDLLASLDPHWVHEMEGAGYRELCVRDGQLCALLRFNFTTGLVVGLDPVSYERRYCFEHATDAREALAAWDGKGHPGGPWIKCKGAGIDLLNPALTC